MSTGLLLAVGGACLAAGTFFGQRAARVWLGLTLAGAAAALAAAVEILAGRAPFEWSSTFLLGGEPVHLRLDALSALFLALLCVVAGAGAAFAHEYWSQAEHPRSAPAGRRWWSAITLSMGCVLLASNGLQFLIAWELFAVSAFFLIRIDHDRPDARAASWLYLASSHAGTLCLFAFFGALAARTGGWDLGPMQDRADLAPLFWLGLVGFGLKAGMFPLHIWLPSAHSSAPSHVSALLSGVALKLGIYGLVRFSGWLPVPFAAGWVMVGIGAVTALLGIAFAFAQDDLKRLLAYCSVENIGILLVGIGAALLAAAGGSAAHGGATGAGATWGSLALAGALLHVWNHGLFKSLLFFGAGSVLHATGTRELSRLGGLWRAMPWTAGLFALGAVAISGLPPLNGFVSEWLVYLGLFGAATSHDPAAWAAMPAAIALGMTGALALATFLKAGALIFLGAPRSPAVHHAHECGRWMRAPMLLLAGACVLIGLAPWAVWPAVTRAVGAWNPAWADAAPPASLTVLGSVHVALAVLIVASVAWLARAARSNGLRRGLTWDCGYAAPTARMQYTSGSFAGIGTGWFAWVLRPERRIQRPRGAFPGAALRVARVPETVLERVIEPSGRMMLQAYAVARRLQHGRLQYYVAYVALGIAALGILVAVAGA